MQLLTRKIVYPEGEDQEISHDLTVNQLVDLNGFPLCLPMPTTKMIVYRVYKIHTRSFRGEDVTSYYLELVRRDELEELSGFPGR